MKEIWKSIPNSKGYEISDSGNFRRVLNGEVRAIRGSNMYGYLRFYIGYLDGTSECELGHRLVAKFFIPEIGGKTFVNHINGIRNDNRISNLEWVTSSENIQKSWVTGFQKRGTQTRRAKVTEEQVREMRIRYAAGGTTQEQLAREYGIDQTTVSLNCSKTRKRVWNHVL